MPCGRFGGGMCPFCPPPPLGPALILMGKLRLNILGQFHLMFSARQTYIDYLTNIDF